MLIYVEIYQIIAHQKSHAIKNGWTFESVESDHRLCAERKLIKKWINIAKQHGIHPHKQACWIKRKIGGNIVIWRMLANGSLSVSIPCIFCKRQIVSIDLKVHCIDKSGNPFHGKLNENDAPQCCLTSSQKKYFKKKVNP